MLPRGVHMHWPGPIGDQRGFEQVGTSTVKPGQVLDESLGEVADFAGGKVDTVLFDQHGADLVALSMFNKTLHSDTHHHVVAHHAGRKQQPGQGMGRDLAPI